jgi:hypothetical protein
VPTTGLWWARRVGAARYRNASAAFAHPAKNEDKAMLDNVLVACGVSCEKRAALYDAGHDLKDPLLSPVYGDMHGWRTRSRELLRVEPEHFARALLGIEP